MHPPFVERWVAIGASKKKVLTIGQAKKKGNEGKWYVQDWADIGKPQLFDSFEPAMEEFHRRNKILKERL